MHKLCKLENFIIYGQGLRIQGRGSEGVGDNESRDVKGIGMQTTLHGPLPFIVRYAGHIMEEMTPIPSEEISMLISGHENGVDLGKRVRLNFSFAPSLLSSASTLSASVQHSLPTIVQNHNRALHVIIVGPAPSFDHILHIHPQDVADPIINRNEQDPLQSLHLSSRGDTGNVDPHPKNHFDCYQHLLVYIIVLRLYGV